MKKDINYYITNGLYNDPELYETIKLYVRSYIQKNILIAIDFLLAIHIMKI